MKNLNKEYLGIFIVWLFHVSAIIGISMGNLDWFISKTPLNLIIIFAVLVLFYPLDTRKKLIITLLFALVGYFAEWLGVNYSILFGSYSYGENLGWKLAGVPLLIGINWAVLVFITGTIADKLFKFSITKILAGASLMLVMDFFMEATAPLFDFWEFIGGIAPLSNYIGWFGVAVFLHILFQLTKTEGNFRLSLHLYICQMVFFGYFYVYFL